MHVAVLSVVGERVANPAGDAVVFFIHHVCGLRDVCDVERVGQALGFECVGGNLACASVLLGGDEVGGVAVGADFCEIDAV